MVRISVPSIRVMTSPTWSPAGVLLANSTLLQVLTALGLPAPAAKLITEVTLFSVSFSVQTLVIFRGKKPEKKEAARHVHA